MADDVVKIYSCLSPVLACFVLSVIYVASLYIWSSPHNRDHPSTIKRRFLSVFIVMLVSPVFLYFLLGQKSQKWPFLIEEYLFAPGIRKPRDCLAQTVASMAHLGFVALFRLANVCRNLDVLHIVLQPSLWHMLGLKVNGLLPAIVMSLLLTMVLFLGPLSVQGLAGLQRLYTEPLVHVSNFRNLIWLRNHIVAPLSEEFTFRACMLPLLVQCFRPMTAVFVCPLFFGIAHFHHMVERMKNGLDFKRALMISCFQFMYTTLFGAYSAFLFVRTGHFAAPLTAHIFCNHMGFPDFAEILTYKDPRRICLVCLFIVGLVAWCMLLVPLTNPTWYGNDLFWKK